VWCEDVDECASNNGGCDANAVCTNQPGSFTCTCNANYVGNGFRCAGQYFPFRLSLSMFVEVLNNKDLTHMANERACWHLRRYAIRPVLSAMTLTRQRHPRPRTKPRRFQEIFITTGIKLCTDNIGARNIIFICNSPMQVVTTIKKTY